MASTKIFIDRHDADRVVRSAKAVAEAKKKGQAHPDAAMSTIRDTSLKGLRIISVAGVASWVMKTVDSTKTLGYLYPSAYRPITSTEKAREIGGYVKTLMKSDPESVDAYIEAWHLTQDHAKALTALTQKATTWTFGECIEKMIEDREKPDSNDPLKPNSIKDIRTAFNRPVFEKIKKTPAVALGRSDFETVRDEVRKNSGISPAIKVVAWTRKVYAWMAQSHSGQSGIDGRDPWWELLHAPYKIKLKTRKPEVKDIVKSLILAEEYLSKPLPGRTIEKAGVGAGVLAGFWWIVMTCQRGDAALSLRSYNFVPDLNREGWMLATWDKGQMKGGSAQMLPIPTRAAEIIEKIRSSAKHHGSEAWCFPSDTDKKKHTTVSGVYRILYRLAGRDTVEQKKEVKEPRLKKDGTPWAWPERTPRRNLFEEADIAWWSAHDVRRTIQTVLDNAGIPGGASVILAHEMKSDVDLTVTMTEQQRDDFMKNRVSRITNAAYGAAQYPKLKAEAMQIWTDVLLDEYDRQKSLLLPAAATEELGKNL